MNELLKFSFLVFAAEKNYNTPKRRLNCISKALFQILISDNSGKTQDFLRKYTDYIEQTYFQLSDLLIEISILLGKADLSFCDFLNKKLTTIDTSNYYLKKINLNTRFFHLVSKIGFTKTGISDLKDFIEINSSFSKPLVPLIEYFNNPELNKLLINVQSQESKVSNPNRSMPLPGNVHRNFQGELVEKLLNCLSEILPKD
jgi:hypothetical protein